MNCKSFNCTITENVGFGVDIGDFAVNTIVWGNTPRNYFNGSLALHFSCTFPQPIGFQIGTNNVFADPQLIDEFHIASTSPCRSSGNSLHVFGTDFDGEPWLSPPSIGADEFSSLPVTGPLAVSIESGETEVLVNRPLTLIGRISGRADRIEWSFGEGFTFTNLSYYTEHSWLNPGDYSVTFTAFNADHPQGVSANLTIHVLPLLPPTVQSISKVANGIQLTFDSQAGVTNTIEFATNLTPPVVWTTLGTIASTNNQVLIIDATATNSARFYRVRAD